MIASIDDSIGILSKWHSERKSLSVVFVLDGLMFSFDGFIKSLTGDSLAIGALITPEGDRPVGKMAEFDLTINLDKIRQSEYTEPRGRTEQYASSLKFTMAAGALYLQELTR